MSQPRRQPIHLGARRPARIGRVWLTHVAVGCAVLLLTGPALAQAVRDLGATGLPGIPPMVRSAPVVVIRTPGLMPPPAVAVAPFAVANDHRPPRRPPGLVVFETQSPRPPLRPAIQPPLEVVAPLPPRGLIATEMLPDFTGLADRTGRYGAPDVAPVDAARADDLVRARVSASIRAGEAKPALDEIAAVAYAACATAGYARDHGFGWLRHIRTATAAAGGGRSAEAIYTLTRDMPEGRAMKVEAVLAACAKNGVPAGDRTGE